MLIARGSFTRQTLAGHTVIVTGAGGGIGFEAARALAWLGAHVVIAEINPRSSARAAEAVCAEFGPASASSIPTDVGDERAVQRLAKTVLRARGRVDAVINNATVAPVGAVNDVAIRDWDLSYRVNLRGPVLLARAFLPAMLARKSGVIAFVSSVGQAYMAPYESLKAAQVSLGNSLSAELEGCGVYAFTIGPGTVPTETLQKTLPRIAALYGKTADEFNALTRASTLSVEAAGAGFAAAVVNAARYHGLEISSAQALIDAGIPIPDSGSALPELDLTPAHMQRLCELAPRVHATLAAELEGYRKRSIFEQQWVYRTFRQRVGIPVEDCVALLDRLARAAESGDRAGLALAGVPLKGLASYYAYLADMAKGYVKNPAERDRQVAIVTAWRDEAAALAAILQSPRP